MSDQPQQFAFNAVAPKSSGALLVQLPLLDSRWPAKVVVRALTGRIRQNILCTDLPAALKLSMACAESIVYPAISAEDLRAMYWPNVATIGLGIVAASNGSPNLSYPFVCPNEDCSPPVQKIGVVPDRRQEVGVDLTGIIETEPAARQNDWEQNGIICRYLTLEQELRLLELEDENAELAVREFVELAVIDAGDHSLGAWGDTRAFYAVYIGRLRHGTDLTIETHCQDCEKSLMLDLSPQTLLQSDLQSLLVEVENIARIFKWPVDAILGMPDPVRSYWGQRAEDINRDKQEAAAKTRRRTG